MSPQLAAQPTRAAEASADHHGANRRDFALAILMAAIVFAAIAPTLTWLEFSGGSENLNLETALEIRRGAPWVLPTLKGEPRTIKPPLTAWLTALAIRPTTVAQMSSSDPAARRRAFDDLAWQTRWQALAAACLMLVAVYELGRTIGNARLGLTALAVCASSMLFLRFARSATTDVQLALWVAVANVFLARALLRGCAWAGCILAGVAIGLALMSKGPVALVQTVVPTLFFAAMARRMPRASGVRMPTWRSYVPATILGLVAMLAIALPWPMLVVRDNPRIVRVWWSEMMRGGDSGTRPDSWHSYLCLIPHLLPWTIFWFVALVKRAADGWRRARPIDLAIWSLFVPIVLMSLSTDKKARYLLPMCGAASVIVAYGVLPDDRRRADRRAFATVDVTHWATLGVMLVGLSVAGAAALDAVGGGHWYSWSFAGAAIAISLIALASAVALWRRWRLTLVPCTLAIMLGLNALYIHGYGRGTEGRSEMRPLAEAILQHLQPTAIAKFDLRPRPSRIPTDLSIYLNRVVTTVKSPDELDAIDNAVLVVPRRPDDPAPQFPGWSVIATTAREGDVWRAYVKTPERR